MILKMSILLQLVHAYVFCGRDWSLIDQIPVCMAILFNISSDHGCICRDFVHNLEQCFSTTGPREILLELITNLNVILYFSACHTVHISVLILFMIMP